MYYLTQQIGLRILRNSWQPKGLAVIEGCLEEALAMPSQIALHKSDASCKAMVKHSPKPSSPVLEQKQRMPRKKTVPPKLDQYVIATAPTCPKCQKYVKHDGVVWEMPGLLALLLCRGLTERAWWELKWKTFSLPGAQGNMPTKYWVSLWGGPGKCESDGQSPLIQVKSTVGGEETLIGLQFEAYDWATRRESAV